MSPTAGTHWAHTPWRPAEPSAPAAWEWFATVAVTIMMTGALIAPIFAPDTSEETPLLRLVWLPVYAVTLGLALRRLREIVGLWPAALVIGSLVALAFLSSRWSLEPDVTVRRSIALAMSMLFALYLAAAWRGPRLLRMLCVSFLIVAVLSLLAVAVYPVMGVHQDVNAGLWRGVWTEKNQAGMMMFTGVIAATCLLISGERGRGLAIVTIVFCLAMLLGSQSKTSLLCMLVGCGLAVGLHTLRKAGPVGGVVLVWLGVVVVGAIAAFFLISPETLFTLLGKDATLTGRTDIWDSLMRRSAEQPWKGYGYAAFWGKESMPANWVRLETEWSVPSAHHAWLEVLIQLGRIGVAMVAMAYALAAVMTLARLRVQGVREGYFGLAYLAAFGVLSLSESVILLHHNLSWALVMVVMASRFLPVRDEQPVTQTQDWNPILLRRSPHFRSVRPARHTA